MFAQRRNIMKKKQGFLFGFVVLVIAAIFTMAGCDDGTTGVGNGNGTSSDDPNLAKVLPLLRHTISVKQDYNKGNKPSYKTDSSGHTIATISYTPNGALQEVFSNSTGLRTLFMYSQPLFISKYSDTEAWNKNITHLAFGTYDYAADPASAIGLFPGIAEGNNFDTLENLKRLSNNSTITEELFNSIKFPSGGHYRLLVFGKNSSGTLIGKYIGYAPNTTNANVFYYWCIDPESTSFGSFASKTMPNS
jgi:hypothetical protein